MEYSWIEFSVIGGYLAVLVMVSIVFKNFSKDASDYFRSGCRGKWWLVGMSCFMTSFSAWTFTGAAGVAYSSGWSAMIIFLANVFAFLFNAACLAPWFRQLRSISPPEIIRKRFGVGTQQFYAWITVCTQMCYSSVHLYGLAIFSSAVFGFNVQQIIIVLGCVVIFYSMIGGSWGVMASDFIQSMVLMPMTILIAILCLVKLGGIDGLFSGIQEQGLASDYRIINDASRFAGKYTWFWAIAIFLQSTTAFNSLTNASRFFAVKDGREARKAALLTACLMFLGSLIWFIPPMTARLLYPEVVDAVAIAKPAEAAYAIISMKLLPLGMTGLMVVAMFAATTSSMDSGLNRNAAVFTNDIYPALSRLFGSKPTEDGRKLLIMGRFFTIGVGALVVSLAYYFSTKEDKGIFQYMLNIGAMLMLPLMIPLLLGVFIKEVPRWAALFAVSCAFVASAMGFFSGTDNPIIQAIPILRTPWLWQVKVLTNITVGTSAFLLTKLFWHTATQSYREQVTIFFKTMYTPIDFEKEVGQANDYKQSIMVGSFCLVIGIAISSMALLPNPWALAGRFGILFVAACVGSVGLLLIITGRLSKSKDESESKESLNKE
jgi:SSS family transporter